MQAKETRETLDRLVDDHEPVETTALNNLSNLTREEQALLDERWKKIPLDKRRRLVELLGEAADEDIQLDFTAVFQHALDDPDAQIRRNSIDGLWECAQVTLIRPFLRLLASDPNAQVQASAASALGRYVLQGEFEELPAERATEIVEALLAVVRDDRREPEVRRRAVESLGNSSDSRVRDVISRAYDDPWEPMRISALFAMGRSADEYWRGVVRAELLNESPAVRFEAARSAGELYDPQAVERLQLLLRDDDVEVRQMAIWALGQIGGSGARRALEQLIQRGSRPDRAVAREALAELELFDEAMPTLLFGADDDDDDFADEE